MAGITREEIGEGLKGNKDKLAEEIAKIEASKKAGENADKLYKALNKLPEET
jgi:hypothetical protein